MDEHKALTRVEIKDADKGEFAAVFSTFNVKDSDGDVTVPGAFEDGARIVVSAYGHTSWEGALPVGKGAIRTTKTEAIAEGSFFIDTIAGADTFKVVKELAEANLGEWSYGYDVVKSSFGEHEGEQVRFLESLRAFEVSPVLRGAGVNTRTLTVKSKFSEHATSVLADVDGLIARATEVVALRAEKGKGISPESADLLDRIDGELKRLAELLAPAPEAPILSDEAMREFLRFVALEQGVTTT